MRPQIRLVAALLFSATSISGSFGQAGEKASDALLAADAAWMKVYAAKDLVLLCYKLYTCKPNTCVS
jgi:hypothetical protein